jgi:hypothetical protein
MRRLLGFAPILTQLGCQPSARAPEPAPLETPIVAQIAPLPAQPRDAGVLSEQQAMDSPSVAPDGGKPRWHRSDLEEPQEEVATLASDLFPLCKGPRVDLYAEDRFRGVGVRENGSATCCPLQGTAFMCVMHDGHQHEATIYERARFFVGTEPRAKLELETMMYENAGMTRPARPVVALRATLDARGELTLVAEPRSACMPLARTSPSPCKHQGRYRLVRGVPVRVSP